ncbi:MAG: hypothetical protein JSW73_04870 [Candidatus Woesearchaeota archaeon]|nr:MAG: hypothetical protein JSW73_04870 [Candidatus Woesearchaeota archaeon]
MKINKINCKFSTKKTIFIIFSIFILVPLLSKFSIAEDVAGCTCDSFWLTCGSHTIEDDDDGPTFIGLLWVGWDLGHHEDYCEVYGDPSNGEEGDCKHDPCNIASDCLFGYGDIARLKRCPAASIYNGHTCFLRCDGHIGSSDFTGAIWDAWDRKCITCNGVLENLVYGDTSDIYCNDDAWDPKFTPIVGDGNCESACGAHPNCDDNVPGEYQESFFGWLRCNKGVPNRLDYCTDSCGFEDRECSASGHLGCNADASCDGLYPGEPCDDGFYCTDTCECKVDCPPCLADCDDDSICEIDICIDINNCGGCGQVCDNADDNNLYTDPDTGEYECVNGWCTCDNTEDDGDPVYMRYGGCKPLTQYSWIPPSCADGSDWSACLTPWTPFTGFSLWTRTSGPEDSAADLCDGTVEYVAKREFVLDDLEEKYVPYYTIYSCNYPVPPFDNNFALSRGVGYLVYPAIPPPPPGGGGWAPVSLYPGMNFVGVTVDSIATQTAIDDYLDAGRYDWICGK